MSWAERRDGEIALVLMDQLFHTLGMLGAMAQLGIKVLVINSLVVPLSLPRCGCLERKQKYFLKEMEARPLLSVCCLPPVSSSRGLGVGAVSELRMLALHDSFPGISGHRSFRPAVLCIAAQQSEVAYPA